MRRFIGRFLRDETGATAIEYGLICALIFLAIVGSITALGNSSTGGFARTVQRLGDAMQAAINAN
ncbi:Flp family type IVb pilin [Brevundimonas sp. SORGH_AS_0993]|uniref:Flp family type IVb pilin n=1 Tax=Brevundimonas sp. SORGH_AS_0993 TaxID=3041794 RepID=UPI002789BEA3|nr:Flp family type IVb pilin [Brevundimonas sp. SORGH_AS_0993]MDQ1154902.1 pilus assembly protein Flp/PilA [Brevundimonas sp. SORGH_AS_0993]